MLSSVRFQDIRRGRYAEKAQVVLVMGNIRFEWSVVCCFWSYLSSTNIEEVKRLVIYGHNREMLVDGELLKEKLSNCWKGVECVTMSVKEIEDWRFIGNQ